MFLALKNRGGLECWWGHGVTIKRGIRAGSERVLSWPCSIGGEKQPSCLPKPRAHFCGWARSPVTDVVGWGAGDTLFSGSACSPEPLILEKFPFHSPLRRNQQSRQILPPGSDFGYINCSNQTASFQFRMGLFRGALDRISGWLSNQSLVHKPWEICSLAQVPGRALAGGSRLWTRWWRHNLFST